VGGWNAGLFCTSRNAAATARSRKPRLPGYSYLTSGETWRFKDATGAEEAVSIAARLSANNAEALSACLEAGEGIALQPDFIAWQGVRDGRLVPVLTDWAAPHVALNLVTPAGGPRSIRTQVLLDFLTRRFTAGAAPWTITLGPSLRTAGES
jgi:DNA-binding transcriptional LysR family regulator